MSQDIYYQLRKRIDEYALGFPATQSGVEIKILQHLFSEAEADLYLHLSRSLEPMTVIAKRAGRSEAETAAMLEAMTAKGVTFPKILGEKKFYAAAPFMHGFFENNAWMQEDRVLAELMEAYLTKGFVPKGKALRTIPVQASVKEAKSVMPFDDVVKILQSKERIGVMPCPCNKHMQALDRACGRPTEVCIGFDFYAEYCIEGLGVGRWIDRQEAMAILKRADAAGLVHQIGGNSENTECLCNCCPDCCGSLRLIKQMPAPSKVAGSNFFAQLSREDCTSCETCIERCPMGALAMTDEGLSLNSLRCIGCGLCGTGCPAGAIALVQKDAAKPNTLPPPEKAIFMKPSLDFEADIRQWIDHSCLLQAISK
ncbi:MAG: 4Fe-4S binding protein [Desulfobacteraceae bacterium]|nr:4Fe-4S binding protein [Desulfobacteraceae bacterium]